VQSGFPFVKSAGWNDLTMIKFNWEIQLENRKICEEENGKKSMRRRVLAFVLYATRFGKTEAFTQQRECLLQRQQKRGAGEKTGMNGRERAASRRLVDAQTGSEMAA
jgi:hypothetical protein